MEQVQNLDPHENPAIHYHLNVDTSRPFRSVKEAIAILGERFSAHAQHIYSPKPFSLPKKETPIISPSPKLDKAPSRKHSSPSPRNSSYSHDATLVDTVKKLEAELDWTKAELKLLKERGSKTEVALASLNADLRKNMSKLARAEAGAGGPPSSFSGLVPEEENIIKRDLVIGRMKSSSPLPSLAQVLSVGEKESLILGREKERKGMMKKKPIIPLVGDLLFFKKKGSTNAVHNPLYASSPLHWN